MKLAYLNTGLTRLWRLSHNSVSVCWYAKPTERQLRKARNEIYKFIKEQP